MEATRTLPWDWYPGTIPDNVVLGDDTYIETSLSFKLYRSQLPVGLRLGKGSAVYKDTMFDLGSDAQVKVGEYALIHGARIVCDAELKIGNYALISWQVVLMDTYRLPFDIGKRRKILEQASCQPSQSFSADVPAQPIWIQDNVWIGFDACILPGVTIGEGAIVGARSVVSEDVPPYTVVAGNPARIVRQLETGGSKHEL
ncbi:MAG: acyltransferase [Nostoc sp. DedQUE12b]|uniref:acyltransferase n=1 Tax=Nostoc sp. DedQUE12b TaxID=3075398 RepID=UPI002AD1DC85|nr:acyltransferase [Nostoc sp. DedQUE12b]MDZ8085553.1 acyltransferase [Nostoc sp. DedQUE12b]